MFTRKWLLGRTGLLVLAVVSGVLLALCFLRPAPVSVAQQSAPESTVDPRWLAVLQAQRSSLEGTATLDGAAAAALTVDVLLQDSVVAGFAASGAPVSVTLRRGGFHVTHDGVEPIFTVVGWMYSWQGTVSFESGIVGIQPGDIISVAQGGQTITVTVPPLSAHAYAAADRISGIASPDAALMAYMTPVLAPDQVVTATLSADSTGVYDALLPSDLQPGDRGFLRQSIDSARSVTTRVVVPLLIAQVDGAAVGGFAEPAQSISLRVISGTAVLAQLSWATGADGAFATCFESCDHPPALLKAGRQVELVTGDQVLTMTVPPLTASADLDAGEVRGTTSPGLTVSALRWPAPSIYDTSIPAIWYDPTLQSPADMTGAFTVAVPLQTGDFGATVIRGADGHLAYGWYALSHLRIVISDPSPVGGIVSGQLDRLSTPITLTIVGPSGWPKAQVEAMTSPLGRFQFWLGNSGVYQTGIRIAAGDIVSVTDDAGLVTTLAMPRIDVVGDVVEQRISGHGPASARLPLHLVGVEPYPAWPVGYDLELFSDLNGFFGVDLTDVRIKSSSSGTLSWDSPSGHTIVQSFWMAQTCLPRLDEVVVGGNTLSFTGSDTGATGCAEQTQMQLRAADGHTKLAQTLSPGGSAYRWPQVDGQGQPVLFVSGDVLSFVNGTRELSVTVPAIAVHADVTQSRIWGRGPAGSRIYLTGFNAYGDASVSESTLQWLQTVTTDSSGNFELTHGVSAGDRIEAAVTNRSGVQFASVVVVPSIKVSLNNQYLYGMFTPLSPVTMTLQTTRAISITPFVGHSNDRGELDGTSVYWPAQLPWTLATSDTLHIQVGDQQRDWVIPYVSIRVVSSDSTVTGDAPPNSPVLVNLTGQRPIALRSDAGGHYALRLSSSISPFMLVRVEVQNAVGDWLAVATRPASWHVDLSTACVRFMSPHALSGGELTLLDSHGTVKASQTMTDWPGSYDWRSCLVSQHGSVEIAASDRLVLTADGETWSFTVPALSIWQDRVTGALEGLAPAHGHLTFSMNPSGVNSYSIDGRTVSIGPSGNFGIDISDAQWWPGQIGYAIYSDPLGNVVQRSFTLTGIQHWLPIIWHP